MPVCITEEFKIDKKIFDKTGALDAILDIDSRLFIDPHLLRSPTIPELSKSCEVIHAYYQRIIKLMIASKSVGDRFWREADKLFQFPELPGICLGYSSSGVNGSGMGKELRTRLLTTTKEILEAGIKDPEIFEIVGLIEKDIGCDRISDMVGRIIYPDLMMYSHRVFSSLGIKGEKYVLNDGREVFIPRNPYSLKNDLITLLPREILSDLPTADSWGHVDLICSRNASARDAFNKLVGHSWREAIDSLTKPKLKSVLINNPPLLQDLVDQYKRKPKRLYDFENDPSGQIIWCLESKKFVVADPLALTLDKKLDLNAVEEVVFKICTKFKDLVENNNLSKLLYRSDGRPKHEEAAQLVFYGIADAYCDANDLDLSRETNGGRGPVDFKLSSGYKSRVVAELKLTSNPMLVHGFSRQLLEYQKAEKTTSGVYLIINVGRGKKKLEEITKLYNAAVASGKKVPKVILINGISKKSASKY